MQQVLPKWMWTAGLTLFAVMVISATEVMTITNVDLPLLRFASSAASVGIVVLTLFFSARGRWAPWRLVWRTFPKLNCWIFPDLNGIWVGAAHSNWTAIEKLRTAASSLEKFDLDELFDLDRKESPIVLQIRCNLFGLEIVSCQSNTASKSRSLSSGIERNAKSESYCLNYTYRQENSIVSATDTETHTGAAILEVEYASLDRAEGSYWTKRCWEDGRNTAGRIELTRVSDASDLSTSELQEHLLSRRLTLPPSAARR